MDSDYALLHNFSFVPVDLDHITENTYVAVTYLNSWYVAVVLEVDHEDRDALLDFMHLRGPSNNIQ